MLVSLQLTGHSDYSDCLFACCHRHWHRSLQYLELVSSIPFVLQNNWRTESFEIAAFVCEAVI